MFFAYVMYNEKNQNNFNVLYTSTFVPVSRYVYGV